MLTDLCRPTCPVIDRISAKFPNLSLTRVGPGRVWRTTNWKLWFLVPTEGIKYTMFFLAFYSRQTLEVWDNLCKSYVQQELVLSDGCHDGALESCSLCGSTIVTVKKYNCYIAESSGQELGGRLVLRWSDRFKHGSAGRTISAAERQCWWRTKLQHFTSDTDILKEEHLKEENWLSD